MSPKQFKYMLEQSYNAGRKQGNDEGLKQGYELAKLVKPKATSAYDDFMRGFCAERTSKETRTWVKSKRK
jgi:hypothetical protein